MASATKVFTSERASAPDSSAAFASGSMRATLGESFTISGRRAILRTALTTSASKAGSLEKKIPPCLVLGHETLSSYAAMPSASSSTRTTSR